jgi:hypothetical protein
MKSEFRGMRLAWLCGWLALGVTSLSAFAGEGSSRRGSGTEADPYQIGTVEQLQGMKDDLAACYVLVNDLDASGTAAWGKISVELRHIRLLTVSKPVQE